MDEIVASVQLESTTDRDNASEGRTMNLRLAGMLGCPDGDTLGHCAERENLHAHL